MPDVHAEFMEGTFSFKKTERSFSRISPDQVHEQNNEIMKGVGGAIPLLNRENDSGLERWELSGTEVARLIDVFESELYDEPCGKPKKHHEDTEAFQNRFMSDVKEIESCIPCNPFVMKDLAKINNTEVRYGKDV